MFSALAFKSLIILVVCWHFTIEVLSICKEVNDEEMKLEPSLHLHMHEWPMCALAIYH